ncbi:hypothetical protein GCM10012320_05020 [Sinomonas cellulolyticus]|nr:hypothetical protein GCM10012320_05020 [Sinomonas sp. KCTC 49339]
MMGYPQLKVRGLRGCAVIRGEALTDSGELRTDGTHDGGWPAAALGGSPGRAEATLESVRGAA